MAFLVRTMWPGSFARIAIEEASGVSRLLNSDCPVIAFAQRHSGYAFSDLIRARGVKVEIVSFSEPVRQALHRFLLPLVPPIRDAESAVPLPEMVLWAVLGGDKFDLLFCEDQFVALAAWLRKRLRGTPYALFLAEPISDAQGVFALRVGRFPFLARVIARALRRTERRLLRDAAVRFFVSRRTHQLFASRFAGVVEAQPILLRPGCEPSGAPPSEPDPHRYIVSVSKWDLGRGPSRAIELARLSRTRVVLAGSWAVSSDEARFRAEVARQSAPDEPLVEVTGPLTQSELTRVLDGAYAYVHWNPEGFGMGIVEALGRGLPVITTSEAGASELLTDGKDGVVVPGTAIEVLADAVNRLLANPSLRQSMAIEARATGVQLSWGRHVENLIRQLPVVGTTARVPDGS